jgi:hypothetical protein
MAVIRSLFGARHTSSLTLVVMSPEDRFITTIERLELRAERMWRLITTTKRLHQWRLPGLIGSERTRIEPP